VTDGISTVGTIKNITITNNNLLANKVIEANDNLFSESTAEFYQWFKNGEKLEGEMKRFYAYNGAPGNYFVVIKNSMCNLPSPIYVVTDLEENLSNRIKLFPNPAFDEVNLQVPIESLPLQVSVINALGQVVFRGGINNVDTAIDTSQLGNGMYVVDISGRHSVRKKLVVRH
jgi:hypothetical protein